MFKEFSLTFAKPVDASDAKDALEEEGCCTADRIIAEGAKLTFVYDESIEPSEFAEEFTEVVSFLESLDE